MFKGDMDGATFLFPPGNDGGTSIILIVRNASGNNLLELNTEGNILANDIMVVYKGVSYPMNKTVPGAAYKLISGSSGVEIDGKGFPSLSFGDFSEKFLSSGYHNETFYIDWGDGKRDDIAFDLWISYDVDHTGGGSVEITKQNGRRFPLPFTDESGSTGNCNQTIRW